MTKEVLIMAKDCYFSKIGVIVKIRNAEQMYFSSRPMHYL